MSTESFRIHLEEDSSFLELEEAKEAIEVRLQKYTAFGGASE